MIVQHVWDNLLFLASPVPFHGIVVQMLNILLFDFNKMSTSTLQNKAMNASVTAICFCISLPFSYS